MVKFKQHRQIETFGPYNDVINFLNEVTISGM